MSFLGFVEEDSDSESEDGDGSNFFVWQSPFYVPEYVATVNYNNDSLSRHHYSKVSLKNPTSWLPPVSFNQKIRSRKSKELREPKKLDVCAQVSAISQSANDLLSANSLANLSPAIAQPQVQHSTSEQMMSSVPTGEESDIGKENSTGHVVAHKKGPFADWGKRLQYGCSFFNVNSSEMVWDLIEPGHFGIMRLKKNNSGAIEAFAEAEIHNKSWTEHAVIIINQQQHLRMLLNVSHDEWCALLETLGDNAWILGHHALGKHRPLASMATAEKLWYFLCKRRHHLPVRALQLKPAGIKKLPMKILPKFIVCQIRNYNGDEIA